MGYSEFAIIPVQLAFAGYAAVTDITTRRIHNLCSYGLLFIGLCAQLLWLWTGTTSLAALLMQVGGGAALAVVLFWAGIFAAGDAKLLWALGVSLPQSLLSEGVGIGVYVVGVNSFLPYGAMLFVYLVLKHRSRLSTLRNLSSSMLGLVSDLAVFYMFYSVVYATIIAVDRVADVSLDALTLIIVSFAVYLPARRFALRRIRAPHLCLLLIPVFLTTLVVFRVPADIFIRRGLFLLLLWPFVAFLRVLMRAASTQVLVADLTTNAQPQERILKVTTGSGAALYIKTPVSEPLPATGDEADPTVYPRGDRFTADELADLRRLSDEGAFDAFGGLVTIQQPIVFAPALLIGLVLTLLARGPFYLLW